MLKTIPVYIQIFFWVLQVVFIPDSVRLYKSGQQESSYQNYTKVYFNPAELKGPERLCNVFGSVLASYFGGGDPATDVYSWQIFSPSNQLIFSGSGGGGFQTINFTFSQNGPHKILLKVFRGGIQIGDFEKIVQLIAGPEVTLEETYEICSNQEIELQAINPSSDNFSEYTFLWTDENGIEIGKENTQKITKTGTYEVKFFFTNSLGLPECLTTAKTKITLFQPFTITPNSSSICVGQTISFSSTPNTLGNWFLQKKGSPKIAPLGPGTGKFLGSGNFQDGFGEYEIILKTTNPSNPDCSSEARATIRFNVEPQVKVDTTQSASDCISADGKLVLEAMSDLSLIQIENKDISLGPFKAGELIEIPNLESGTYTIDLFLEGCSNSLGAIVPLEVIPPSLEYEILDVQGESCTETGKINGSFNIKLQNGPLEGSYQLFNSKGDLILKNPLPEQDEFEISIGGGKYLFEILDKDSCNFPKREEIEIPSKFQTFFLVPEELNVCQSLDFIPQTSQPLTFTLTYPDGKKETKPKGQPFLLTQKGDYSILGVLENQTEICPRSATFKVNLIDPIDYEPKLIDQDCFGNRTYKADIKDADPTKVKFQWFNEKNELVGTGQLLNPVSFGKFKLDVQPINSTACPIPPKEFEIVNPVLSVDLTLSSTKLCELGPRAILDLSSTFPDEVTDVEWRRYDANGNIEELPQYKNKYQIIVDREGTYEASAFSRIPAINKDCELGRKALKIDLIPERVEIQIPGDLSICDPYELTPTSLIPLEYTLTFPDGTVQNKPSGQSFTLNQEGTYTLFGIDPNPNGPKCPEQKTFKVKVNPPVLFDPVFQALNCDGSYLYQAKVDNYPADSVVYLWKDSFGNVAGTSSVLQTFTYGTFSLEVQPLNSIACTISPKEFEIAVPVLSVDLTLSSTKLCELGPRAILDLSSTFPDEITDVEWRRYDANGNIEELPQYKNKYQVIVDREGTYEAAVFSRIPEINKNCELGRKALKIDLIPERVEIQIPGDLSICDPYELTPTSLIPLEYTLTFPDGTIQNKPSGQSFTLNQEGTYTLFGIDPNPNGQKCPEQKTFKVKVNPPVLFTPVFQTLNCDGSYLYQAKVDNYPADSVVYLWKDSFGNVAGTSSVLQTFTYGTFSLEVQPKGSIPCTSNPISFDIPVPVLKVDVTLSAEPLCPDQPNAALTVNADFAQVTLIEWWYTDINNNRIQLTSETDKKEIAASQNGTYEVLVKNSFGCILGQDQLLVLRSTDQVRPELKEKYLICPNLQIGPNLNPGNFASYEWYFEGRLVSSDPIFKPLQLGAYDLFVQSQEGCVYQATFTTAEECDPKLRIPDAIQPENPDKQFLIYTNYLVDELELWIYNKWGNLIFHCKKTELIDQESTCVWDGTYRGEKVPAGSYVYRVNYKNIEKNIQKTETNSFLVID